MKLLIVIDPQIVFSETGVWPIEGFYELMYKIKTACSSYDRVIVTKWMPCSSELWKEYNEINNLSSVDSKQFDILSDFKEYELVSSHSFDKSDDLPNIDGYDVTLSGVSTECCVLATAIGLLRRNIKCTIDLSLCGAPVDCTASAITVLGAYKGLINVIN